MIFLIFHRVAIETTVPSFFLFSFFFLLLFSLSFFFYKVTGLMCSNSCYFGLGQSSRMDIKTCVTVLQNERLNTLVKKVKQLEEERNARYFIFSFKVSYKFQLSVTCHVISIVDGQFCGYLWPIVGMLGEEPAECQLIGETVQLFAH